MHNVMLVNMIDALEDLIDALAVRVRDRGRKEEWELRHSEHLHHFNALK